MKIKFKETNTDVWYNIVSSICCIMHVLYGPGHVKTCFMPYANNKGAEQPAHPRSLVSAFVVHSLDSIISLVSRSEISRF